MLVKIALRLAAAYAPDPGPSSSRSIPGVSDSSTGDTTFAAVADAFRWLCVQEDSSEDRQYSLGLYIKISDSGISVPKDVQKLYIKAIARLFSILDEYKHASNRVLMLIFDVQSPLPDLKKTLPMPKHIYHLKILGLACASSSDPYSVKFLPRVLRWAQRDQPYQGPRIN
ncbi:uncharacterized protein SCHCODRAFT_02513130 [Schizophyllum commune H4-8]|nr:uncharacterized protein SCHCODRAFT_02513130 [Schizophyllum commune H4-8]KAI5888129.1 hypothetical protein SCHCODRAFT_02513130 [Schizophyllum commune H4-8]